VLCCPWTSAVFLFILKFFAWELCHPCDPTSYSASIPPQGGFQCSWCDVSTPARCPCLCSVSLDPTVYALVKGDNITERSASQRGRAATKLTDTGSTGAHNASLTPLLTSRYYQGDTSLFANLSLSVPSVLPISRDAPARLSQSFRSKINTQKKILTFPTHLNTKPGCIEIYCTTSFPPESALYPEYY